MGNKLGRRRQVVEDKYTRPQGLYHHKDVDHKKLRKLILDAKLAPCYPGDEDNGFDLEECPICFLYYPSLNRSRCCMKGICTECFLQMKTPNSTRPTQCPFCKTSNYAVEFRGVKTKEEKGLEQIEEQRVIEAKIRMRQQQLQDEEERKLRRRELSAASSVAGISEAENCSTAATPPFTSAVEGEDSITPQESRSSAGIKQNPHPRQTRDDGFDLDLEDIMVMEAIWLSIQENGKHRNPGNGDFAPPNHRMAEDGYASASMTPVAGTSSASPSGGLACAIAALAERQQTAGESSSNYEETIPYNTFPGYSRCSNREDQVTASYPHIGTLPMGELPESQLTVSQEQREWTDQSLEVSEVGTSYMGCEEVDGPLRPSLEFTPGGIGIGIGSSFQAATSSPIIPESFEEQMMLAMAVSLAEVQARTSSPGVAWH